MKQSIKVGISFGVTSGIITTLGLMVGMNSGTHLKIAVIGSIITIAVADSFSDALGIHVSEETHIRKNTREIWESTLATLLVKILFTLTFLIPVLLLELNTAIIVSIIWGFFALGVLSYVIAREKKESPLNAILEHLITATFVITATHFLGVWISGTFS